MQEIGGMIGAVVTGLSVIGGGIAWWIRRRDGRKDPVPKESAAVALSREAVGIMQGVADELRQDLADVRKELSEVRRDQAATSETVSVLQSSLSAAARYIERLLRWAKSESRPPLPSLPTELRDLIDPSLHD